MAAAAEALRPRGEHAIDFPLVIPVAELPEDELVRLSAGRFIRAVGATALQDRVEDRERFVPESDLPSLKDAIQAAANGNEQARQFITMSVLTDVVERTIKAGHVARVGLESDAEGYILQHGQRMTDVYANSLQLVSPGPMRRRAVAEAINGFRMVDTLQQKLLEDYAFVVFSRYPDDMTDEEASDAGFFADTKSCSIQALREWDGRLVQESAFVAGVKDRGAERHDRAAIEGLIAELGAPIAGETATEALAMPMLVHRSLMPNGVVDLVRRYDNYAGGTFFGQSKPRENYIAYLEKCREREEQLEPRVQGIVSALIAESATVKTPVDAIRRLHELSQRTMVDHAIRDTTIDPRVFGAESAAHIEQARYWLEQGDYGRFLQSRDSAQGTAQSSSCPAGITSKELAIDGEGGMDGADTESSSASGSGERKKMTCPFCGNRNQHGDPCSPNQYCHNCSARIVNGKVVSKGNGGRKETAKPVEIFAFRRQENSRKVARLALAA